MSDHIVHLSAAGDILAAIPHLLGFYPSESIVLLVTEPGDTTRLTSLVRADLGDMPAQLSALVTHAARQGRNVIIAVVAHDDLRHGPLPRGGLVTRVSAALHLAGVQVHGTLWAPSIGAGRLWACYCCDETGTQPDPAASQLAVVGALSGRVTHTDRESMGALLSADDPRRLEARTVLIERAIARPMDGRRAFQLVHDALIGDAPRSDDQIAATAAALLDPRARDAALTFSINHTERLAVVQDRWLHLARTIPAPYRAEAAIAAAITAHLRGDGVLANLAAQAALDANPDHSLARLIAAALHAGITPDELRPIVLDAAVAALQDLLDHASH